MNLVQATGFPFPSVSIPITWASFGAHSFKIDAVFEMHRKNADAVVRATCVVLDGLNRMAKRQGDLLAAAVGEHIKVTPGDVASDRTHRSEKRHRTGLALCETLYVSSVASLRELSDIAVNTNVIVADILTTRVKEAFDEFGVLLGKPGAPTSSVADATVVAEPTAGAEEAAVANEAAFVEAVSIVGPAAKTRPKKVMPPTKHGRRPTSRG